MANEIKHLCNECIFLTSDVIGRWICTRPDGSGNYKAHPYVGACREYFKPKSKKTKMKAEKFIQLNTKKYSNETRITIGRNSHWEKQPWLTPEQALRAVEIARKELIDKACEWLKSYRQDAPDGTGYIAGIVNDKTIDDFKKAMGE